LALMLGSLYEALTAANVSPDKAQKAAEEVAGYDNRLAKLEADLTLLKWMVGFNLAATLAVLMRVVFQ
jgi:hypothetical protein